MAGLRAAARLPTNLAIVYDFRLKDNEGPAKFLEGIMDAFCHHMHLDPEETANTVALAFINQSAAGIRRKFLP